MNLKDEYNPSFVTDLATKITTNYKSFDKNSFITYVLSDDWEEKELKERMRTVTTALNQHINLSFKKQVDILWNIAPHYNGLQGFIFSDFVQVYGLNDYKTGVKAMEHFTQYSTAEFAVRPFIEKYPEQMMQQMLAWSKHHNHHVRRLASEGCRPKLPWAPPLKKFINDPAPCLPILENLKNDESEYVRKSVANHLNDISKNHPNLVLQLTKSWYGKSKNTNWIVKHALRTLLKAGNKKALEIFGFANAKNISVSPIQLSSTKIKIGDTITFKFTVKNESSTKRNIRLEYKIVYVKANGNNSSKVFQISEFMLTANKSKVFNRKQSFKDLSTRKHYTGMHQISLIVNGEEKSSISFKLQ